MLSDVGGISGLVDMPFHVGSGCGVGWYLGVYV